MGLQNNPPAFTGTYPYWIQWLQGARGTSAGAGEGLPVQRREPIASRSSPLLADILSLRCVSMWLMIISSASSGFNIAGSYKSFGALQPALNSDAFLTLVGAFCALGNAGG